MSKNGIFTLNSHTELFQKCLYEYQLLTNCRTHPEYDYILFNIIASLNHLKEWFLKDDNIADNVKDECKKKFHRDTNQSIDEFQESEPSTNDLQYTIRLLCNNAKHFVSRNIEDFHVEDYPPVAGNPAIVCSDPPQHCCTEYLHYLYCVSIGSEQYRVDKIVEKLIDEWKTFLNLKSTQRVV